MPPRDGTFRFIGSGDDFLIANVDGTNVLENADGQGRIIWGKSLDDIFAAQNLYWSPMRMTA